MRDKSIDLEKIYVLRDIMRNEQRAIRDLKETERKIDARTGRVQMLILFAMTFVLYIFS